MDKENRRKEIIKMYDDYCMNDFLKKVVSQEEAMVKAAEDKTVLEFAKEFIEECVLMGDDKGTLKHIAIELLEQIKPLL